MSQPLTLLEQVVVVHYQNRLGLDEDSAITMYHKEVISISNQFQMSEDEAREIMSSILCLVRLGLLDLRNFHRHELDPLCWVDTGDLPAALLPSHSEVEELWNLHPQERGKIKLYGKVIDSPRWFQSYGKPYTFSGVEHLADETPLFIEKFMEYVQAQYDHPGDGTFNQCLVNWYGDGDDYIAAHADDENHMYPNSPVVCISFGHTRTFRIRKPNPFPKEKETKSPVVLNLSVDHGSVYVMGGHTQERVTHTQNGKKKIAPRYTHESPPLAKKQIESVKKEKYTYRISLTFRKFR